MAKRDCYDVLGIPKGASKDDIKKAYRKLALKYHPDKTKGDKASEEKFKEASEAYHILSDDKRKANYDQFGHAAFESGGGGGGFQNGGGGGAGGYRESSGAASGCFGISPLGACVAGITLTAQTYPISVGAGGVGTPDPSGGGTNGSNSIFSTITSRNSQYLRRYNFKLTK